MSPGTAIGLGLVVALALDAASQESQRIPLDFSRPETFTLELSYRTVTSKREAVPNVSLHVGVAHDLGPVALLREPGLACVETDEHGLCEIALQVPSRWKGDPDARVWLRVETPGFQRTTWCDAVGASTRGPRPLVVGRGGTVFGALRTPAGAPVPDARVWLLREESGKYYSARSNEHGEFVIPFKGAGRYRVHARSGTGGSLCGTAQHGPVELDGRHPPEPLELVLRPLPSIAGRIVDPAGDAVHGARVLAVPVGALEFPDAHACGHAERRTGLLGGCGRADAEGRFQLGQLVPGEYDFYADLEPGGWVAEGLRDYGQRDADGFGTKLDGTRTRVATRAVESGTPAIELVYAAHRVEVTVRDERGAPVSVFSWDQGPGEEREPLSLAGVGVHGWMDDVHGPRVLGDLFVYLLASDREYAAILNDGVHPLIERRFRTSSVGPWRSTVDLRLGPPEVRARLRVRVLDPSGVDLPRKVHLRSTETQREIECRWHGGDEGDSWAEVPAGRFALEATAEPELGCTIPWPRPRAPFSPATTRVELAPGEERSVALSLGPAGYLDFESVRGDPGPVLDDERFKDERGVLSCDGPRARSRFGGGVASLVSTDGDRLDRLEFDILRAARLETGWIVPGWSARCLTPIPPGTWTLRVEGDAGLLFQREVTIHEQRATLIRW